MSNRQMIQMVLIKQMVPNSKRRRNVFKSCWNEPRVKPIPLYKKRCYFHESFFESPTPHTRERLSTCVYSITTIKKKSFCVLGLLWKELCQQRESRAGFCVQGQRAVRQKEPHLAPDSSRAISHRGSRLGNKDRGFLCPGRDLCCPGSPWTSLLTGGSWKQPGFAGNFETALQLDKRRRDHIFCAAGFLFLVLQLWFFKGFLAVVG